GQPGRTGWMETLVQICKACKEQGRGLANNFTRGQDQTSDDSRQSRGQNHRPDRMPPGRAKCQRALALLARNIIQRVFKKTQRQRKVQTEHCQRAREATRWASRFALAASRLQS